MSCFRPLTGFQDTPGGKLRFLPTQDLSYQYELPGRELKVPCGACIGCFLTRSRVWATRCIHEASLFSASSFVTLTYDDAHCPLGLDYSHFQAFMRALRKAFGPVRFFAAGEYGALTGRPHFHALLFGASFTDGVPIGKGLFSSRVLAQLWPHGFSSVGAVTYESAGYVARYAYKKLVRSSASPSFRIDAATGECGFVRPEFAQMSRRPGLGYYWFLRHWDDVYAARDAIVRPGGLSFAAPRYYDDLLAALAPDLREYKDLERYLRSGRFAADCTPRRLFDREVVARSTYHFHAKRGL